jgi:formylmethanofuran dehydrogenase subunit E
VNKYGRYAKAAKTITLEDLIKFHGHFCGGLVEAATVLKVALNRLFPDGMIDRTDLRIASNNSACGGDVAAYLTGARARFGSHSIDKMTGAERVHRATGFHGQDGSRPRQPVDLPDKGAPTDAQDRVR